MLSEPDLGRRVGALCVRVRSAYALALAEVAIPALVGDPSTFDLAGDALRLCWQWADGVEVDANEIVIFVEGPENDDLVLRTLRFPAGPVQNALVTIGEAISYVAHHAFDEQRINVRPSPIWEVTEETLSETTTLVLETGQCNFDQLERLVDFLATRNAASIAAAKPIELSADTLKFLSGPVFKGKHD